MNETASKAVDMRRAALVEVVSEHGVCPRGHTCDPPHPDSADCRGCIAAWAAPDELERGA